MKNVSSFYSHWSVSPHSLSRIFSWGFCVWQIIIDRRDFTVAVYSTNVFTEPDRDSSPSPPVGLASTHNQPPLLGNCPAVVVFLVDDGHSRKSSNLCIWVKVLLYLFPSFSIETSFSLYIIWIVSKRNWAT